MERSRSSPPRPIPLAPKRSMSAWQTAARRHDPFSRPRMPRRSRCGSDGRLCAADRPGHRLPGQGPGRRTGRCWANGPCRSSSLTAMRIAPALLSRTTRPLSLSMRQRHPFCWTASNISIWRGRSSLAATSDGVRRRPAAWRVGPGLARRPDAGRHRRTASYGIGRVLVRRIPRIALLSTGTELADLGMRPLRGRRSLTATPR